MYILNKPVKVLHTEKLTSKKILLNFFLRNQFLWLILIIIFSYVFGLYNSILEIGMSVIFFQILFLTFSPYIIYILLNENSITPRYNKILIIQFDIPLCHNDKVSHIFNDEKRTIKVKKEVLAAYHASPADLKHKLTKILGISEISYLSAKEINLYHIIHEMAQRCKIDTPKITLLDTSIPNAAVIGFIPKTSLLLLSLRLISQYNEKDIQAVLAHEFSHLKHKDVIFIFSIGTIEYLLRLYLLMNKFILSLFGLWIILYIPIVITLFFLIVKIIELRSDIDAVKTMGSSSYLINVLSCIMPKSDANDIEHLLSWISWTTHPPIDFRLKLLERIDKDDNLRRKVFKSPLVYAFKLSITDFLNTLLRILAPNNRDYNNIRR